MEEKRLTPMKAIRAKCLDCCCWQINEVRLCTAEKCPLYPFRMGKNPYTKKKGNPHFGEMMRMRAVNGNADDSENKKSE